MTRTVTLAVLIVMLVASSAVSAQTVASTPNSGAGHTTLWTLVGAGAGFGVGIWAGLHVFDDSVNSERKVWTTTIVSTAAGAVLGHLIGRSRSRPSVQRVRKTPVIGRLTGRDFPVVDCAPALGSGAFRDWIEQPRFSSASAAEVVALRRAMGRLDDIERALLMCYLDDLSYARIGEILGMSESNVGVSRNLNRVVPRRPDSPSL